LDTLESYATDKTKRHKDWPGNSRKLSGELRRLAPNLRRVGVAVDFDREPGAKRRRLIHIEKKAQHRPHRPDRPKPRKTWRRRRDGRGTVRDDWDGQDGRDGVSHTDSFQPADAYEGEDAEAPF
jgi:hypothetical protein